MVVMGRKYTLIQQLLLVFLKNINTYFLQILYVYRLFFKTFYTTRNCSGIYQEERSTNCALLTQQKLAGKEQQEEKEQQWGSIVCKNARESQKYPAKSKKPFHTKYLQDRFQNRRD